MNDDIDRPHYFIRQYSTDMIQQRRHSTTGTLQLNLHITDHHLTLKSTTEFLEFPSPQKTNYLSSISSHTRQGSLLFLFFSLAHSCEDNPDSRFETFGMLYSHCSLYKSYGSLQRKIHLRNQWGGHLQTFVFVPLRFQANALSRVFIFRNTKYVEKTKSNGKRQWQVICYLLRL